MCTGNTTKTKEIQSLSFSRKIRPFWKKFLYHQLPNMMIHNHTKFDPLEFINKRMTHVAVIIMKLLLTDCLVNADKYSDLGSSH